MGVGRPLLHEAKLSENLTVRVDKDTLAELTAEAKRQRQSVAELIRNYITWGLPE